MKIYKKNEHFLYRTLLANNGRVLSLTDICKDLFLLAKFMLK